MLKQQGDASQEGYRGRLKSPQRDQYHAGKTRHGKSPKIRSKPLGPCFAAGKEHQREYGHGHASPDPRVKASSEKNKISRPKVHGTRGGRRRRHDRFRSSSGRRGRVVLDGGGTLGELLAIRGCTGVTVADLLIQNVRWNGIKLDSDTGVQRATIRNCVLHNIWQRAVKGVAVPEADRERLRPRGVPRRVLPVSTTIVRSRTATTQPTRRRPSVATTSAEST